MHLCSEKHKGAVQSGWVRIIESQISKLAQQEVLDRNSLFCKENILQNLVAEINM